MAEDDSVTLNCQQCDAVITFSEVSKVTEDYARDCERKYTGKSRDAGVPQHMLESYVDVEQPGQGARTGRSGPSGLRHILELASAHGRIDHPICAKCLDNVMRDLQERTAAVQAQAQAYQEALQSLEASERAAAGQEQQEDRCVTDHSSFNMSAEQLLKQLEVAEREEQVERERTKRLEQELAAAQQELDEVAVQEKALKSEEDEFWRRYDALWLDLYGHLEEVDTVATRVDVAARQLDSLRQTSVLEDCFHIWCAFTASVSARKPEVTWLTASTGINVYLYTDAGTRFRDRFGTISGFRLGRHKEDVKWSEVNAAWGQAVLLLDMMTRMYTDFVWQQGVLKPMASHSLISDGKEDYKLFGPVNRMWSGRFDKAMMLYLHCLDSFSRFAREKDQSVGREALILPNPIDPEKGTVRGLSIRFGSMVGNSDNWNRALKYMLVDLKIMLHWVTKDQGVVDAGSSDVPVQMTAAAESPSGGTHSNSLANSTFVPGSAQSEWSRERGAQSMMHTGEERRWW